MKSIYMFLLTLVLSSHSGAKGINCKQFEQEASSLQKAQISQNKDLKQMSKQIDSSKMAIDNFNKNCRSGSKPECNPAMFQMITSQMPLLIGQRDQIHAKIGNLKLQEIEATKNLKSCKSAIKTAKNMSGKAEK